MKDSHYNMYMKNVKHWTQLWGTIVQQQASRQKQEPQGLSKQMFANV